MLITVVFSGSFNQLSVCVLCALWAVKWEKIDLHFTCINLLSTETDTRNDVTFFCLFMVYGGFFSLANYNPHSSSYKLSCFACQCQSKVNQNINKFTFIFWCFGTSANANWAFSIVCFFSFCVSTWLTYAMHICACKTYRSIFHFIFFFAVLGLWCKHGMQNSYWLFRRINLCLIKWSMQLFTSDRFSVSDNPHNFFISHYFLLMNGFIHFVVALTKNDLWMWFKCLKWIQWNH